MTQPTPDADVRSRVRADGVWYLRHDEMLRRWPVLPEAWARRVERARVGEPPPFDVQPSPAPRSDS